MAQDCDVYICSALRTPFGKFWGSFKDVPASRLGAEVIKAILWQTQVPSQAIDGVYMGQVLTAGEGQNPARRASRLAGLPDSCPALTFNKVCSSSLVAIQHAVNMIRLSETSLMIAGGMENMSRVPYLIRRWGKFSGNKWKEQFLEEFISSGGPVVLDSMIYDGLTELSDPANPHMGALADQCARIYEISRREQDHYALQSISRTLKAQKNGALGAQIIPITHGNITLEVDECVRELDREEIARAEPFFTKKGTVTTATSSKIADGAAALLLASDDAIKKYSRTLKPRARILAFAAHSHNPRWYTTAPALAIKKILGKTNMSVRDVDLFEVNEAFAVVPLHTMRQLGIRIEKINIFGGAISLGHPLGATGARIVGNLLQGLLHTNSRYGIACACNGGGEAVAVLIENMQLK